MYFSEFSLVLVTFIKMISVTERADGRSQLSPTFQSDGLRAVEVQQGSEGAAVCIILQEVLHQGEWRNVPLSMLSPVPGLKPWQRHKDITLMCHRGGHVQFTEDWWKHQNVCRLSFPCMHTLTQVQVLV